MNDLTTLMRQTAKELLENQEVSLVLGWEKGTFWYQSPPAFIKKAEDAERLVWDDFCLANLAHYLLDYRYSDQKIALFVKGCDSRGVNRLLQDLQVKRERVVLIGIPCPGLKDAQKALLLSPDEQEKLPLAARCQDCRYHNPVVYDRLLGEKLGEDAAAARDPYAQIAAEETKIPDERYQTWESAFSRCIRCFACRNVCPACNCTVCCFDLPRVQWISKQITPADNAGYLLTRAFHVAGRCIECGECEEVCPMGLPLMQLNKKIAKDIRELFEAGDAGVSLEVPPPLGIYSLDDPDQFM